jgi:hypothetical protein
MYEFWNKFGLLIFIIGVAGIWGNYSLEGIGWIYLSVMTIGILLYLMPRNYYEKKLKNGDLKNE